MLLIRYHDLLTLIVFNLPSQSYNPTLFQELTESIVQKILNSPYRFASYIAHCVCTFRRFAVHHFLKCARVEFVFIRNIAHNGVRVLVSPLLFSPNMTSRRQLYFEFIIPIR